MQCYSWPFSLCKFRYHLILESSIIIKSRTFSRICDFLDKINKLAECHIWKIKIQAKKFNITMKQPAIVRALRSKNRRHCKGLKMSWNSNLLIINNLVLFWTISRNFNSNDFSASSRRVGHLRLFENFLQWKSHFLYFLLTY